MAGAVRRRSERGCGSIGARGGGDGGERGAVAGTRPWAAPPAGVGTAGTAPGDQQ